MHYPKPQSLISWIPAHGSSGGPSMRRYWQHLAQEVRACDRFQIQTVGSVVESQSNQAIQKKLEKLWARKISHPFKVKTKCRGALAHVLDHSWADMLAYVPKKIKKVVTVHDLIPLRYDMGLTPSQLARFRSWVNHLHQADLIIADSAYSKGEVNHFLGIDLEKIHVVPAGVELPDLKGKPHQKIPWQGVGGFFDIGSIGNTEKRKNLALLPEALAKLKSMSSCPIRLIRAGALLPKDLSQELKNVLGEEGFLELGRLDDSDLDAFYRSLDVLVFPSLFEGFGLPVLEALAQQVRVVSSSSSSLPEVGLDLVNYFNPESAQELAQQLFKAMNEVVADSWRDAVQKHVMAFSWRHSLEKIYQVYDLLLEP